jgi:DNA-binding CsgD family transcriptional regulator
MDQQGLAEENRIIQPSGFLYLTTILGFGLCRAWIVLCIGIATPFISAAEASGVYLLAGAAAALLLSFLAPSFQKAVSLPKVYLVRTTTILILASIPLILVALPLGLPLVLFTGIAFGGLGSGCLQVLWGERFALQTHRFSTIAAPSAAIITALLVALTSQTANLIALALFPLASLGLLFLHADKRFGLDLLKPTANEATPSTEPPLERRKNRTSTADIVKLMVSIAVFSFLCRSYDTLITTTSDPFAFIGGASLLSLIVVGTIFLLFVFASKNRFNALFTYRLSLPLMVTGFAVLTLFVERYAAVSLLIINTGYEFFDILIWILFAEIAHRQGEPFRVFGLGVAFTLAGMAGGYLLAPPLNAFLLNSGMPTMSFSLLSIISLVIVAFLLVPVRTLTQLTPSRSSSSNLLIDSEGKEAETSPLESRLEQQCNIIVTDFGLTARETEVLLLLARGRTLAIIARELQIANGTARTHIENIYTKLDVHKQQELIDLVETYGDSD